MLVPNRETFHGRGRDMFCNYSGTLRGGMVLCQNITLELACERNFKLLSFLSIRQCCRIFVVLGRWNCSTTLLYGDNKATSLTAEAQGFKKMYAKVITVCWCQFCFHCQRNPTF